ncbi:unnamed protein product [Strongylus vulgaris]|uniref:Carbohydrate sulfotransferase n=1 Tax=Strongylus vulgaris TaxID=40348 RepID=A0A3P7LE68_STRVU|nr:unnamed protein product [Strongylus vulgaris]
MIISDFAYIVQQMETCDSCIANVLARKFKRDADIKEEKPSYLLYPEVEPYYKEVEQLFQQGSNTTSIIAPFVRLKEDILVSPAYNLATCQIENIATELREALFCYLNSDLQSFVDNETMSTTSEELRLCNDEFSSIDLDEVFDFYGSQLSLFTQIRHPIDRFITSYAKFCLKYCNFKNHKDDYIFLNYHIGLNDTVRTANDLDKVLEHVRVPADIRTVIRNETLEVMSRYSLEYFDLRMKAQEKLLSDGDLLKLFMQIYYHDFVEFGFK